METLYNAQPEPSHVNTLSSSYWLTRVTVFFATIWTASAPGPVTLLDVWRLTGVFCTSVLSTAF